MPLFLADGDREERAMKVKTTMLAAGAALVMLGGSLLALASYAGAQEPQATPPVERGEGRAAFLERVAARLGVNVAQLQQAIEETRLELIEEALGDGRIDEGQAAKARERVASGDGPGRLQEPRGRHERRAKVRAGIIEHAAEAIGISADELKQSLKAGNSIADEAEKHGVALEAVKSSVIDAAKAKLDSAVANGRIDQSRADEMLAKLEARLDELLIKKRVAPAATP
jgi:hypothetical protein